MTVAAASPRIIGAVCALALTAGALAACTPTPEPSPTPTALFSSDEEAFAAAEETYRAYLEALNEVEVSDTKSFEEVFSWSSGSALAALRESLSQLHAEKFVMTGDTTLQSAFLVTANASTGSVTLQICADVSETDLRNSSGESVVPTDRSDVQALRVGFARADTATGLAVNTTAGDESLACSP